MVVSVPQPIQLCLAFRCSRFSRCFPGRAVAERYEPGVIEARPGFDKLDQQRVSGAAGSRRVDR